MSTDVAIVGAGLAGLTCAQDLTRAGVECCVLEASDGVGGRVRTDLLDGFQLDRGFQILLCAYPQIRKRIDLERLGLGCFEPGALVRAGGAFHRMSDPLRRPLQIPATLAAPVGSLADKARLARLVLDVTRHPVSELLRRPEESTALRLTRAGFGQKFIEEFWRPLFAGIQLDPELEVSSRRFETILRMIAQGPTGLPRQGIGAVPAQLAESLPEGTVRLGALAAEIQGTSVVLAGGEWVDAAAVVLATDGPTAHRLLGDAVPDPGSRAAGCCWLAAPSVPRGGPILRLDGETAGPAKNVVVISDVCPSYAPPGYSLVAAAVPGPRALDPAMPAQVAAQLAQLFGSMTSDWQLLRTDVIPHGQPLQVPPFHPRQRVSMGEGIFVCGDHRDTASVQGAMFSGERTAAAVLASFQHSE